MMIQRSAFAAAGVAATAITATAFAGDPPNVEDLQAQIQDLRAEVAELRAENGEAWLSEARAEEIRGLVYDVLADADTRASLLQGGASSGYDGGFVITSPDGNFSLKMNGQLQIRYVYNHQNVGSTPGPLDDENRAGFEVRRAKVKFKGHIGDPRFTYMINGAYDRGGGNLELEEGLIGYSYGNGWSWIVGQYKAPFTREELVSSSRQLAVERSLANEMFTGNRTTGIQLTYENDQFRVMASVDDGFTNGLWGGTTTIFLNASNTGWQNRDVEFSVTARAEMLIAGDWGQFKDLTSPMGSETGMLAGVGVHWQKEEYGTTAGPEEELWAITGDFAYEADGWNVFASGTWGDLDVADRSPFALVAQGSVYLSEDFEIFGRYEYLDYDAPGLDEPSVFTVGFNKYFSRYVKWTTDVGYATESIRAVSSSTGWRNDEIGEDGQFVLRSQLQLVF